MSPSSAKELLIMNSPKLRFKNFNDEWKTFKIQDTFVFLSTNSLSRDSLNYNNGTIQNIHYGDIHTILPTICNVNKEKLPYINYNAIYKNTNFVQENDLLIADASENYDDIGKSIEVIELDNKKIVGGLHTLLLRCELNLFAPKFKGYLFNTNNIRTQIKILSVGAKVLGISKDNLKKITFSLPSLEEQTKIANFLSLIDRKIELQEKLVENLKLYKKGLLQKVFSNNHGWKSAKLGDFLIEYNKKTTINNQYDIISSTSNGLYLQKDYFDKQVASKNNIGYKILKLNQIVFSPQNLWLGNINYNNKFKIGIVSPSYKIYSINQYYNSTFISYLMTTPNAMYQYKLSSEQGASIVRRNLDLEKFLNITFKIPNIEEQNRIANLFSNLDKKIDFETNRLTKLKEYKKGLLQQMFI
mgnify:CR=1 FL=1